MATTLVETSIAAEVLTIRTETDLPLSEVMRGGVRVRRIPFHDICRTLPRIRGLGIINTLLLGLQIGKEIRALARSFDVLHAVNASQPPAAFAVRAARATGLRTLVRPASINEWFDLAVLRREPLWGPITERWLRKHTDRWVAISEAIAHELEAAGVERSRIRHLPNGVVLPPSPRQIPVLATRFLHLGRLASTAPRDIRGLIGAFERVLAESPRAELALVGGGDQLAEVKEAAASSPAASRIRVPGPGDGATWRAWAHCLVQPSFVEGMSNALLEGLAEGIPCIAYDIPPNREVLADGSAGTLVPVGDHAALADSMKAMATVPGLARDLGRRGRARAEAEYDIRRIAAKTVDLYRELIDQAP